MGLANKPNAFRRDALSARRKRQARQVRRSAADVAPAAQMPGECLQIPPAPMFRLDTQLCSRNFSCTTPRSASHRQPAQRRGPWCRAFLSQLTLAHLAQTSSFLQLQRVRSSDYSALMAAAFLAYRTVTLQAIPSRRSRVLDRPSRDAGAL